MADVFNIAGRIHSTSQEEVVTTTNEILDATQGHVKKQSEVNQDVSEELALHTNRLNALTGQNYITVQATQSTTAADIPTLINATGEGEQADTLYRVGFWDGSAYVADKYTEYAWNGTAYVILDVKSSIGEVFDISQYNAVGSTLATYADLAAALSGTNVPASVSRGGMSIKFVQSSDNKYVQFRLMTDTFSTFVADWQGVDITPASGSKNLAESGGVADRMQLSESNILPLSAWEEVKGCIISGKFYYERTNLPRRCVFINVQDKKGLLFKAGMKEGHFAFVTNKNYTEEQDVDFADGESRRDIAAESSVFVDIPSDAVWLYVTMTLNTDRTPSSVIVDGYDYMKYSSEMIGELNEDNYDVNDRKNILLYDSMYTGIPYIVRNRVCRNGNIQYTLGDYDIALVKLDDSDSFDIVNPNNLEITSKNWFNSLNTSSDTYIGASNIKLSGAKLCLMNIRNRGTSQLDYNGFMFLQPSNFVNLSVVPNKKATEMATHKLSIEYKEGTKVEGKYITKTGGVVQEKDNVASLNHYDITIDHTKKYRISNAGSTSYNVYTVGYYNNVDGWFDVENLVNREVVNDFIPNIPSNATKMAINAQNTVGVPIIEEITIEDEIIFSDDLEKAIETIESTIRGNTKVVITNSYILVRNHLNSTEDIITEYRIGGNNQCTWFATYLGLTTEDDSVILTKKIQVLGDSTGPLAITTYAPYAMWAQHGYCIPRVTVSSQTLDNTDIGSQWKDQLDREYTVGKVEDNYIFLLPKVRATEITGVYTRDWKNPSDAAITTLEYIPNTGGTHTSTINVSSTNDVQLMPLMVLKNRKFIVDGKVVSNGVYYCTDFIISETFSCTDPWTIETFFPSIEQVSEGAELTEVFAIHGLSCRYDTILNMKKPYLFNWYGANQVQHFVTTENLPGYTPYGMIPRVKKLQNDVRLDTPYDISNTSRGSDFAVRSVSNLYDVDKMPDRFISWMQKDSDKKIGCASGFSLTRGITVDSIRKTMIPIYQSGYQDCISCASGLHNKVYLKAVVKDHFENNVLPASFICSISTYLSYFNPNANVGQVYWYKDVDGYVVYAHYQDAYEKVEINLSEEMEGLNATVIDKTEGVSLLTDFVGNGKIYVSTDNTDHNYVVLKLS